MKPAFDLGGSLDSVSQSNRYEYASALLSERVPHLPLVVGEEVPNPTGRASLEEVRYYYTSKTEAILRRYGPGPRVHYHTGLVDEPGDLQSPAEVLRQRLVQAQERILYHAAEVWQAPSTLYGDVLDVGCGLGGGSLFWAQEFGARVTAVTCVPSHAQLVEQFAARAGVEAKVRTLVADALEVPGQGCFDAIVAVDSSCHLSRREWFRKLFTLLRPGGQVFISDCFLGQREYEEPFNRYWHARIGTISEYLSAAQEAGLRSGVIEDLTSRTEHFWTITLALIKAEAKNEHSSPSEASRRNASVCAHRVLRRGLHNYGLRYALLSFSKGYGVSDRQESIAFA
jgi:tocopherol O-methyltransferase